MSITDKAITIIFLKSIQPKFCNTCQQEIDLLIDDLLIEIVTKKEIVI